MTKLAAAYIEELAEGRIPAEDSPEAKEYRAWSWAWEQLRKIQLREIGREMEIAEELNGEMYR
jgi:hypothetical protein